MLQPEHILQACIVHAADMLIKVTCAMASVALSREIKVALLHGRTRRCHDMERGDHDPPPPTRWSRYGWSLGPSPIPATTRAGLSSSQLRAQSYRGQPGVRC